VATRPSGLLVAGIKQRQGGHHSTSSAGPHRRRASVVGRNRATPPLAAADGRNGLAM